MKVPPSQQIISLPKCYTDVPAVALQTNSVAVPKCHMSSLDSCIEKAKEQEKEWINAAIELLPSEQLSSKSNISRSAHHASRHQKHFHLFMHFRIVIQLPLSLAREKSIWQAWQAHPDATEAMEHLADHRFQKLDSDRDCFRILERLVVVMYDRTSHTSCINEARILLFVK